MLHITFSTHSFVMALSLSLFHHLCVCVCVCVCVHRVLLWTVSSLRSGLYVVRMASHWVKLLESNTAKMSLYTGQFLSLHHTLIILHCNCVFNTIQKSFFLLFSLGPVPVPVILCCLEIGNSPVNDHELDILLHGSISENLGVRRGRSWTGTSGHINFWGCWSIW